MSILRCGLTFVAFLETGAAFPVHHESARLDVCAATAADDRLRVVGPLIGGRPVWLADGSSGHWRSAEAVKSLWVLSHDIAGPLRVEGRRLDGPGVVSFQDGLDARPTNTLLIPYPGTRSVMPSGASGEVMWLYVFIPTYLIFPSPGCWQLMASLGDKNVRIVLELKSEMR